MLLKCHIHVMYAKYFIHRYKATMSVYIPHWYTYISHYWHIPMKKYTYHSSHVCPTTCLL